MDSYYALADLAARSRLTDRAFSALPDAPVLPVRTPRRPFRPLITGLRALRRPASAVAPRRTARRECASTA